MCLFDLCQNDFWRSSINKFTICGIWQSLSLLFQASFIEDDGISRRNEPRQKRLEEEMTARGFESTKILRSDAEVQEEQMIMTENNIVSARFFQVIDFPQENESTNCVKSQEYAMSSEYQYEFWWKTLKVWRLRTDDWRWSKEPVEDRFHTIVIGSATSEHVIRGRAKGVWYKSSRWVG